MPCSSARWDQLRKPSRGAARESAKSSWRFGMVAASSVQPWPSCRPMKSFRMPASKRAGREGSSSCSSGTGAKKSTLSGFSPARQLSLKPGLGTAKRPRSSA